MALFLWEVLLGNRQYVSFFVIVCLRKDIPLDREPGAVYGAGMATRTAKIEDKCEGRNSFRHVTVINNDVWHEYVFIRQTNAWGCRMQIKIHVDAIEELKDAIDTVLNSGAS